MDEKQMRGQSRGAAVFLENIKGKFGQENTFFIAQYSDRVEVEKWREGIRLEEKNLLELRIFDRDKEWKLFRSSLGQDFSWRCRDDNQPDGTRLQEGEDFFDEIQLLDIDIPRSKAAPSHMQFTTAGGSYCLPADPPDLDRAGIRIRHYFGVEEASGQAFVKDYRLVGFEGAKKRDYRRDLKGEK